MRLISKYAGAPRLSARPNSVAAAPGPRLGTAELQCQGAGALSWAPNLGALWTEAARSALAANLGLQICSWLVPAVVRALFPLAAVVAVAGCPGCNRHDNSYEVGFINLTAGAVRNVTFDSVGPKAGLVFVEPGSNYRATMGIYSDPLPPSGSLEWTTVDGKEHLLTVPIPPKPRPFKGILWVKFTPDGTAKAVPLTDDEYFNKHIDP